MVTSAEKEKEEEQGDLQQCIMGGGVAAKGFAEKVPWQRLKAGSELNYLHIWEKNE